MQDVIFILILTAFFAFTVVFVKACELIIGPDIEAARSDGDAATTDPEQVAA